MIIVDFSTRFQFDDQCILYDQIQYIRGKQSAIFVEDLDGRLSNHTQPRLGESMDHASLVDLLTKTWAEKLMESESNLSNLIAEFHDL